MTPDDARIEEITSVVGNAEDIAPLRSHLKEVLEGEAFKGSQRSGQFLKHIVEQAIAGHFESLKERVIGIEVFGRSASYDTGADAIVRVTASDVRKRLLQHYGLPGTPSEFRISLPSGSYVPKVSRESYSNRTKSFSLTPLPTATTPVSQVASLQNPSATTIPSKLLWLAFGLLLTVLNLAMFSVFWSRYHQMGRGSSSTLPWSAVFNSPRSTQLITSDPNIAEIQGFTGGQISLSDYANQKYIPVPNSLTTEQYRFCTVILRGDKASSVDPPIVADVAQLAQASSKKIIVHGARGIQLSDLQTDENLVLLGSPRSNPWVGLFESHLDFRFEYDKTLAQEVIRNVHPRSGELSLYVATAPGWATGQSYAIIAFIQNPDQNGQVLLLAGENGEGTEAAGKLVTDLPRLATTLKKCGIAPSGALQHFEILLHLNTMAGSPSNIDAAACHIL